MSSSYPNFLDWVARRRIGSISALG
jgi:hypothetical protein